MQLIDKNEKEMSEQEKLELEIMRTLAVGRGYDLRDSAVDFDFKTGSNFSNMAKMLIKRFVISFKDHNDMKKFWPINELHWEDKMKGTKKNTEIIKDKEPVNENTETSNEEVQSDSEQSKEKTKKGRASKQVS